MYRVGSFRCLRIRCRALTGPIKATAPVALVASWQVVSMLESHSKVASFLFFLTNCLARDHH